MGFFFFVIRWSNFGCWFIFADVSLNVYCVMCFMRGFVFEMWLFFGV